MCLQSWSSLPDSLTSIDHVIENNNIFLQRAHDRNLFLRADCPGLQNSFRQAPEGLERAREEEEDRKRTNFAIHFAGDSLGPSCAARIRSNDCGVLGCQFHFGEKIDERKIGAQVICWNGEESLNLSGVKIDEKHTGSSRLCDEISHTVKANELTLDMQSNKEVEQKKHEQLGSNGLSGAVLAILAGISGRGS